MTNYRLGVDIGGTSIKAGILDQNNSIIHKSSVKTPDTFEAAMKALADLVFAAIKDLGLSISDFPCIGVGTPCSVIPGTGKLVFANNTNWKNVSIKDELSQYIPIPLYFGNDANCAIFGETIAGAAKGKKNVVMITLGTGVGGGIIIDGRLFAGGDGLGAELGHTPIVHNGIQCSCGFKGCLECYASATALIRQTKQAMQQHPESMMNQWVQSHKEVTGVTAFDCAKAGDAAAMEVVDTYASYIASGLVGFTNIFRPEIILIGGGVSNAGDFLLDKVRFLVKEQTLAHDLVGGPVIQRAILGNDAGIIGAAHLDQM